MISYKTALVDLYIRRHVTAKVADRKDFTGYKMSLLGLHVKSASLKSRQMLFNGAMYDREINYKQLFVHSEAL